MFTGSMSFCSYDLSFHAFNMIRYVWGFALVGTRLAFLVFPAFSRSSPQGGRRVTLCLRRHQGSDVSLCVAPELLWQGRRAVGGRARFLVYEFGPGAVHVAVAGWSRRLRLPREGLLGGCGLAVRSRTLPPSLIFSPVSAAPERASGRTRAVSSPRGAWPTPSAAAHTSPTSPSSCRWSRWR